MTIDEAFKEGLRLVREAGLPAKGTDIPVLAAFRVFDKASKTVQYDELYAVQGPLYAKKLILMAFAGKDAN